jgi:uncharacterized protein (TIGR02246 family)
LAFGLLSAACGAAAGDGPPVSERDTQALVASLDRLAAAWNQPDGAAWGAEYWPDGELVNVLGMVHAGPGEVGGRTSQILAGPFRGSRFSYTVRRARMVGADAAIVDTDITISGFNGLPGVAATKPGVLVTRMKHVFERRNGTWHIAASQNTAIVPASPAGG